MDSFDHFSSLFLESLWSFSSYLLSCDKAQSTSDPDWVDDKGRWYLNHSDPSFGTLPSSAFPVSDFSSSYPSIFNIGGLVFLKPFHYNAMTMRGPFSPLVISSSPILQASRTYSDEFLPSFKHFYELFIRRLSSEFETSEDSFSVLHLYSSYTYFSSGYDPAYLLLVRDRSSEGLYSDGTLFLYEVSGKYIPPSRSFNSGEIISSSHYALDFSSIELLSSESILESLRSLKPGLEGPFSSLTHLMKTILRLNSSFRIWQRNSFLDLISHPLMDGVWAQPPQVTSVKSENNV